MSRFNSYLPNNIFITCIYFLLLLPHDNRIHNALPWRALGFYIGWTFSNYLTRISININGYVLRIFTMLTQDEHSHREHTKLGNCLRENLVNSCRRHSLCFFVSFTKSVSLVFPLIMAPTRFQFVARKKKILRTAIKCHPEA